MDKRNAILWEDFRRMQELDHQSSLIDFLALGQPPDRYCVFFHCRGLKLEKGKVVETSKHEVHILLEPDYPQASGPTIVWQTPIYHPNIEFPKVCLGRPYHPNRRLDEICLTLGGMIQYKIYELTDFWNGDAAQWARENLERLPIDRRDLRDREPRIRIVTKKPRDVDWETLKQEINILKRY